jgi:hypothetical protein
MRYNTDTDAYPNAYTDSDAYSHPDSNTYPNSYANAYSHSDWHLQAVCRRHAVRSQCSGQQRRWLLSVLGVRLVLVRRFGL